ncbi:hypothetical protein SPBR_03086 [Sporothrix brasiliensis 5110]|uniref:Uncharacterized protein n=1 Tax=Sporothrix brasiliensis 5110 TaxID=1398154 RepID=A0A0C2FPK4_9PEZI|nr:uncharacterized protein SPBR_03086 [Sporothrix brasiliensis 5110]KIH92993.1 hypothetical protein SPBR_03086 [Sporothrix brasiliensis 5110]
MSSLLDGHMKLIRLLQDSSSSKALGSPRPEAILGHFMAAVSADDVDALKSLLDEHFPERTKPFPGVYFVSELLPVVSHAARHGQVAVLKEPFAYESNDSNLTDFAADDALDAGAKDTLLFFLEQRWDMNEIRKDKITFLASALSESKPPDKPDRGMVLWLIQHGADLNARPPHVDDTAMSRAVINAPPDLICELLDSYGGDVHRGQLLHSVLLRRPGDHLVEVMGLLLSRGAPLSTTKYAGDARSLNHYRTSDLGTPLHMAALMGKAEAVQYLLSQGADASICSTKGQTALQGAEKARRDDVVAILRSPDQYKL